MGVGTKAQLSLEFLLYTVVSGISLAVTLGVFLHAQGAESGIGTRSYIEELVASINAGMAYSGSEFSAYVPKSLCNATVAGGRLNTASGSFALDGPLEIEGNALCPSASGIERIRMIYAYNGTYTLYR